MRSFQSANNSTSCVQSPIVFSDEMLLTYYQEHHQKDMTPENQVISPQERIAQGAFAQGFGDLDENISAIRIELFLAVRRLICQIFWEHRA